MKAAAAFVFCLIMTVVNSSTFFVPSETIEVDGEWVTQCSVEWGGSRYISTVGDGQKLHLPSVNGGYCFNCGECNPDGMGCTQDYMGSSGSGCPSSFES